MSWLEREDGRARRSYATLPLERPSVAFFPMTWTVVRPIDEQSPLHQQAPRDLEQMDAEVLVALDGMDEATRQQVVLRTSYKAHEIIASHRFADIFDRNEAGLPMSVDVRRLDEVIPA